MIRVASYNIRKSVGTDWRRRPERVLAVLREVDADIVALQEVDRRFGNRVTSLAPALIEEHTDYDVVDFGVREVSIGWHGNVTLVRRGLEVIATSRVRLPALEPRGATLTVLRAGDLVLRVVGMHLGLIGLWRKRQANAVLATLEAQEAHQPTVLMGDLNEWTTNGSCMAAFRQHHHVAETGPSFHSKRPLVALDRIMTSPDLTIQDAGVHTSVNARMASDHLPIWAVVAPTSFLGAQSGHAATDDDRA